MLMEDERLHLSDDCEDDKNENDNAGEKHTGRRAEGTGRDFGEPVSYA